MKRHSRGIPTANGGNGFLVRVAFSHDYRGTMPLHNKAIQCIDLFQKGRPHGFLDNLETLNGPLTNSSQKLQELMNLPSEKKNGLSSGGKRANFDFDDWPIFFGAEQTKPI